MSKLIVLFIMCLIINPGFCEKYLVIEAKDARIIKKVSDIDSLFFIDSPIEADSICTQEQVALGYYAISGNGCPFGSDWGKCESPIELKSMKKGPGCNELDLENRYYLRCCLCLSHQTSIATPKGSVNVKDLKIGTLVWTQNEKGRKVARPILKLSSVPVDSNHQMIHLILMDKRELWVSPGHPAASSGRLVDEINVGNIYDGSKVISTTLEKYNSKKTYDLLPAGETGYYWANDVLMGSTLKSDDRILSKQ